MSFVEQDDIFQVVEKLMVNLFKQFSSKEILSEKFPRISFKETMKKYGTDKPDLRNPLIIEDLTKVFSREDVKFEIFKKLVKSGSVVKAIITKAQKISQEVSLMGLINGLKIKALQDLFISPFEKNDKIEGKGPVGKFFSENSLKEIMEISNAKIGDSIFLACGKEKDVTKNIFNG